MRLLLLYTLKAPLIYPVHLECSAIILANAVLNPTGGAMQLSDLIRVTPCLDY